MSRDTNDVLRATIAGCALVGILFTIRATVILTSQPEPLGYDGYFYVAQVDGLLHDGKLRYPTQGSFVFYVQAAVSWLLGNTVSGVKVSTALMAALLAVVQSAYVLRRAGPGTASVVALAIVLLSAPMLYLVVEFSKTLLATLLLLCGMLWYESHRDASHCRAIVGALPFCGLAALTHDLAIVIGALLAGAMLGLALARQNHASAVIVVASKSWIWLALSSTIVGAVLAAGGRAMFRQHNHLGFQMALTLLPVLLVAVALLACREESKNGRGEDDTVGLALVSSVFAIAPLCYLQLSDKLNQVLDRALLVLLVLSVGLIASAWRWLRSVVPAPPLLVGTLGLLALFAMGEPPGIEFSATYGLIRPVDEAAVQYLLTDADVIAPHGIDFLLAARFGARASHQVGENASELLYWYVPETACLGSRTFCSRAEFIDLGWGGLIADRRRIDVVEQAGGHSP